jgi:endonuclease YncB( thermonuclease family)
VYEYSARLIKLVDGDTLHAAIDLGLDINTKLTIRLYGVNAPEVSTPQGREAAMWVADWFHDHCPENTFVLRTTKDKKEKYGRYLGTVIASNGAVLNEDLLAGGHAVPYFPK